MSGDDRDLEALAQDLARYRAVGAPATLRSRVRSEIMSAPVVMRPAPRRGWLGALRPLLATLLVVAVLGATAGSAAAGSLPGDPAFPVKRAVEDVQVALTTDDVARLEVLSGLADRRLSELEAVSARGTDRIAVAMDEYAAALARVERQLEIVTLVRPSAARDAAIARATAASAEHIARLRTLEEKLPSVAQPGLERAIDAQERIHGSDRGPASPETPSGSSEPAATSRPGARPGGAPGTAPGNARTARPSAAPTRTDRPATPTHR